MSLILQKRKTIIEQQLKEENVEIAFPQYQNTRKLYMDAYGNFQKHWTPADPNAYNRPIKKIHYNLWNDTRTLWPK